MSVGKLLPIRHPNKDFFIVDLKEANPKDDLASMEHPIFSLSVKPDMRELEYISVKGDKLRVIPSGRGLATIMDKDILLYCISKLIAKKNKGEKIYQTVEMTAHEVMVACNWPTNNHSYKRFEEAMIRLRGTTIITTIKTGNDISDNIFGLVESADIKRKENGEYSPFGRMSKIEIKLSDWTFRAVEAMEVLTIDKQYFRLRRPLERRLYEIARKHAGQQENPPPIGIKLLRAKVGTNAPLKKFRFNLKQIIEDGNIPGYGFEIINDNVYIKKLFDIEEVGTPKKGMIPLRPDTLDRAQKIAAKIGVSLADLEYEWNEWARSQTDEIRSPDGAFIGFCKQKLEGQKRQGNLF